MNPHVIIQFSWANTFANDALAVDDMMHYAGIGEYIDLGRPNVAYLIKALHRGTTTSPETPVYGFNVFKVEQDQTTLEVPAMKYRCGVQEDTLISITPASMGMVDDEGGGTFTIEMRDIREAIERRGVRFDRALEHEM